jgi:hypothetical protein
VSDQTVFIDAAFVPMTAGCNEEKQQDMFAVVDKGLTQVTHSMET